MSDPKKVAQMLIDAAGGDNVEMSVTFIMLGTPIASRAEVIMEFFHKWRNIPPSRRSGVNEVRNVLERDFPQYWEFLRS